MKKRLFTLLALMLSVGLAAPACGGGDDDDDDNPGTNGDGGGGGSGNTGGGNTGGGNTGGGNTGGGNTGGGNTGGNAGSGGGGGNAGDGGGNQQEPDVGELVFVGGDIDEVRELFPFGVAVGTDSTVFVSTLGNRNNEPSRIYRFNANSTDAPEILFEVGNAADAAVYGLNFSKGKLYACISDHLLGGGGINASIYVFDSGQLNLSNLGPNNVKNNELRATAVNANNNGFKIADAQTAGRCGQFAVDNDGIAYAPDVSGDTDFIYRSNPLGTLNQPAGQVGDNISDADLDDLKVSAWFEDAQIVGVNDFGVPGMTFDGSVLRLFLDANGNQLFELRPSGNAPEGNLEFKAINQGLTFPFGIAAVNDLKLIASDRDADGTGEVVVLTNDQGTFNASVRIDNEDDPSMLQPGQVQVVGSVYVVAGTQFNNLAVGGVQDEDAKIFIRKH
jgi:hypothetical protein